MLKFHMLKGGGGIPYRGEWYCYCIFAYLAEHVFTEPLLAEVFLTVEAFYALLGEHELSADYLFLHLLVYLILLISSSVS